MPAKKRKPGRPKGTHKPAEHTVQIFTRLSPDLKAAAESAAKADSRNLSQWVRLLIEREIQESRQSA